MQLPIGVVSCGVLISLLGVACSTPKPAPDSVGEQGEQGDEVTQPLAEKPESTPVAGESFVVQGVRTMAPGQAEADQTLFAAWSVTSSSPDYLYMFGRGEATNTQFTVRFDGPPPAEAINSYGVGVAIIGGLARDSVPVEQGRCDGRCIAWTPGQAEQDVPMASAFADRYAVLWVDPNADLSDPKLPEWMREAPKGYSCGKGVPATNQGFDSFEQVDCSQIELRVDSEFEFVNWT